MSQQPDQTAVSLPIEVDAGYASARDDGWYTHQARHRGVRPFGWRIPVGIIIAALLVAPGTVAILAAGSRYAPYVGTGLVVWGVMVGLGLLVFLAVVYVVFYVVSAAWHDAQRVR